MKFCIKCGTEKPLDEFQNNRSRKDGKSTYCKGCLKAYSQSPEQKARKTAYMQEYNKSVAGSPEHREYHRAYNEKRFHTDKYKQWRTAYVQSPEGRAVINKSRAKRRAALHDALVPGKEVPRMDVVVAFYGKPCLWPGCDKEITKRNPVTFDHIVPLSKGGKHTYENCQPLCKSHNCQKHTALTDYRNGTVMTDEDALQTQLNNQI